MLLTALLGSLLAPAPSLPVPDVVLLRLAPDDALAVARVKDVRGLLSRRETSNWVAFLADPEWRKVLSGLRDASPNTADDSGLRADAVVTDLLDALAQARGAVAMVVGSLASDEAPVLAFAALGGDELVQPLRALVEGDELIAEREGDLEHCSSDSGAAEAYLRRGDLHLVIDAADAATALRFGREALARLDAGTPLGGRLAAFRDDLDAELSLDLRDFWRAGAQQGGVPAEAKPFWDALASVEWIHGRMKLGASEHMDLTFEAPYRDEGLATQLFGAFGPCDPLLLGLAPSVAISASVGQTSFDTLLRNVLAEVLANAPEQHAAVLAALGVAKETLGIDVQGELVEGLTGDYVSFSLPADMYTATGAASADERLGALDLSCTAFGIRDAEPFIVAIDAALDAAGLGTSVESTTLRGAEVWSIPGIGAELLVAAHPKFLCFAFDSDALVSFLSRVNGDEDAPASFLAKPAHAAAARELSGSYVSLAPTRATLTFLGNSLEVLGLTLAERPDLSPLANTLVRAGKMTVSAGHRHFSGLLRGRMVVGGGRILAQTEAR
jgi:hypothetical protein